MYHSRFWHTDWLVIGAAILLSLVGLAAIRLASELTSGRDPVERQAVWVVIAIIAMCVTARVPYEWLHRFAYVSFAFSIPLLIAVFWTEPVNGAQRWLRLGPIGVQPSELAKLAFVLAMARYLSHRTQSLRLRSLVVPGLAMALVMALVLKQPDLGTAMLFAPVLMAMLYGAGIATRHLLLILLVSVLISPVLWSFMSETQRSRVTGFLEQRDTGPRPRDQGYQLYQSKMMIALGGAVGCDDATDLHLPFDHTDFVFSVIAGQWGLAGVTLILPLVAVVLWRGLCVARTDDPFGRILAFGLVAILATQTIINLAMTVGLAPITGLTLPFVSYGGSSLLTCFIAVGLLVNVDWERYRQASGASFA